MLRHKSLSLSDCQLKFAKDDTGTLEAYASVFGGIDSYGDTIHKGAYARSLKEQRMPYLNFAHRDDRPLGKVLEIKEDEHGLLFRAEFTPGNSDAQNIRASVVHGAVDGLSIEFRPYPGGATAKDDNSGGYDLTEIKLRGIAVVPYPADDAARVIDVKSEIQSIRDFENWVRDAAGISKSDAVALVARFKSFCQGEPDSALLEEITRLKELIAQYERRAALDAAFERTKQLLEQKK